jgi:phospholipase C
MSAGHGHAITKAHIGDKRKASALTGRLHMGSLQKIDHIVVLMLENRSFDSLLGMLYPKSVGFEGLNGTEQNPDANGTPVVVWNSPGTDQTTMRIPNPDPGELWTDINMQLFGNPAPTPGQTPTMAGFVQNYLAQQQLNPQQTYDPKSVMHYFAPAQVPVLSQLAQKFAVCDHWFASAPCQTWPNRWFVHAGTADGHENNDPPHFPDVPTIFNRLEQAGVDSWKIYFHDIAQAHTLLQLLLLGNHFQSYRQFQADCQTGRLPAYSFIEPQYFADFGHPENDQHPPSVVTLGEQLIADVYNCLRASKVWRKTLLVISYDEHGGCYDHVAPSAAVPPEPPVAGQTFTFDRYGVRVPAVIVSPYVAPGTIFGKSSAVPFDYHCYRAQTLRHKRDAHRARCPGTGPRQRTHPAATYQPWSTPTKGPSLCTGLGNRRGGADQAAQFHAKGAGRACH